MNEERCENCVFWEKLTINKWDENGYCLRHAPVIIPILPTPNAGPSTRGQWPYINKIDWCGDFAFGVRI